MFDVEQICPTACSRHQHTTDPQVQDRKDTVSQRSPFLKKRLRMAVRSARSEAARRRQSMLCGKLPEWSSTDMAVQACVTLGVNRKTGL